MYNYDYIIYTGMMFTCADCVGTNVCFNGLQSEFHLILNIHQQIVKRESCELYRNEYDLICRIGTGRCVVNVTSSSDYFLVKCHIGHVSMVVSARVYLNTTLPSCTG